MGMYTEVSMGVRLKEETPLEVIQLLELMTAQERSRDLPDDLQAYADANNLELFDKALDTRRWWMMLCCGPYYFDRRPGVLFQFDTITEQYYLSFTSSIKNYEQEWQKFFTFIGPWIDAEYGQYLGTYQYEEDERPTLLFYEGGIVMKNPSFSEDYDVEG